VHPNGSTGVWIPKTDRADAGCRQREQAAASTVMTSRRPQTGSPGRGTQAIRSRAARPKLKTVQT